jgi:hypothetical protein
MTQQELDEKVIAAYHTEGKQPILDGIVNEEIFRSGIPKILWLMKEPYGSDGWSMREALNNDPKGMFKYKTFKKIAYTSYGIINKTSYTEAKAAIDSYEILKSIAFINISKWPVEQKTDSRNYGRLSNTFDKCKSVLLDQINYIKPDIIIGGSVAYLLINHYGLEWKGGIHYLPFMNRTWLEKDNVLIVDAKHPSAIVSEQGYCNEIITTVQKWLNGDFRNLNLREGIESKSLTATSFFQKWLESVNESKNELSKIWRNYSAFTSFIKSDDNNSILKRIASRMGLECYSKDYYCIDSIFYQEDDLVPDLPADQFWFRNIKVAFEHENHFQSGLYKEVSHLLITNSDLKVLVTYPDNSDEDGKIMLENLHKIIKGSKLSKRLSDDESFLIIFGFENGFEWVGYTYKETYWKPIIFSEEI